MSQFDQRHDPPTKRQFARLLTQAIRQVGDTATIHYDAQGFRLVVAGEEKRFFNLANIYREYCATPPAQRRQALGLYVRSWFANRKEIPSNFEDVLPDLRPAVRNRCSFETSRLLALIDGLASPDWPYQVIADHLIVSLVYDLPEALIQVQQHHLADWGCCFDEALDAACANLRQLSHRPWHNPYPGVWVSPWRDNHDASRLVLRDLLQACPVQGGHVAMVPNRDTLIISGSEEETGLAHLAGLAEKALEQGRPISGIAFLLGDKGWRPWLPDAEHPLYNQFHLLQLKSLGGDYATQKDFLDALHKKTGQDIWVASYSPIQNTETGKSKSYCVWTQGTHPLLPRAEEVYFVVVQGEKEGRVVARASWDRVQQVIGHLLEPQGIYPVRYRVKGFPTAEQLAEMGENLDDLL